MKHRRYCLTLDLKSDPKLIAEYKEHHDRIWPEITKSIFDSGVETLEIYLLGNRLFMIMEVGPSFSFEAKSRSDASNPKVQAWERLMWKYQEPFPQAKEGEKWMLMDQIFKIGA